MALSTTLAKTTRRAGPSAGPSRAPATRDAILRAASVVFAKYGFDGGSIEKITRAAKTHDRMIYYYFGSKEKLYIEVIENVYRQMSDAEAALVLDTHAPVASLIRLVDFVWQHYCKHPEFMTLLNTENLRQGRHIAKSRKAREYSSTAISLLDGLLASGVQAKLFRADISARDVYLLIAGMGYFYQSNRYTLAAFLGEPTQTPDALDHWHSFMRDVVLRAVAAGPVVATQRPK